MRYALLLPLALLSIGCTRSNPVRAEQAENITVLVARDNIPQWTAIRKPEVVFEEKTLPMREVPPTYVPPAAIGETKDRLMIRTLRKGEVMTWESLQSKDKMGLEALISDGKRCIAFKVTPDGAVGGFVLPGSHVDVFHVVKKGDGYEAKMVLEDVLVRAVDLLPVRPDDKPGLVPNHITIEVTPEEALTMMPLCEHGTLRLALRRPDDRKHFRKPEEKK